MKVSSRTEARRAGVEKAVLPLLVLALLLAGWQVAASWSGALGIPTIGDTLSATFSLIVDGSLVRGLFVSNVAMALGFGISLMISLPLGVWMGLSSGMKRLTEPYLTIMLAVPMISVVPIVQVAFGLTLTSRVIVIVLFTVAYMTISTVAGVRSIDERLVEMARSFNATRLQVLTRVILPAARPGIFAGIRLGLGRAILGMIVAELLIVSPGIGSMILDYQANFQPAYVFGILGIAIFEGILLVQIAAALENKLSWWQEVGS